MKKISLIMPLLAAMAFTSCSSDEPIGDGQTTTPSDGEGTGNTSYVSIAIASNNAPGSRADYEDGTGNEATVKNVVLFFYDEYGQPLNVNMGTTNTNYKIIKNPTLQSHTDAIGSDYNVEHWFTQTQQLHTKSNVTKAKVLAWVNINTGTDANGYEILMNFNNQAPVRGNISMSGLGGKTAFFTGETYNAPIGATNRKANSEFVMSSSTYLNEAKNTVMREVDVNIYDNQADAEKNVATIYVERVRARVTLTAGGDKSTDGTYTPDLSDVTLPTEFADAAAAKKLKLKVLGWTLNTVCKNAYFFKQLEAKDYGFDWSWNDPTHHRSYWEDGYDFEGTKAVDGNYFDKVSFMPSAIKAKPGTTDYCNPNTTAYPTKALVRTQLQHEDGTPVAIAKWYGNDYLYDDLKTAVLSTLQKGKVLIQDTPKGEAKYKDITEDNINFVQGDGTPGTSESWRAYPVLTKQIENVDVNYFESAPTETNPDRVIPCSYERANYLLNFYKAENDKTFATEGAKIWKEGYAYYFVDIKHFGTDNTNNATRSTGVVRNHSYNIEIEGFKGLGTPIYNPDQLIPEPDLPEDDKETYVAVKMNVLSWRIVPTQKVTLGQ